MLSASGAGGGYDTYARIFARHIARYIPGNHDHRQKHASPPRPCRRNTSTTTKPTRNVSTIAAFTNGSAMEPLFGHGQRAATRAHKFNWLGSTANAERLRTWHQIVDQTIAFARAREVTGAAAVATSRTPLSCPRVERAQRHTSR